MSGSLTKNPDYTQKCPGTGILSVMVSSTELDAVAYNRFMQDLVSGSAATIQFLKGVGAAVVFIAVYSYWRWLPQPHSF